MTDDCGNTNSEDQVIMVKDLTGPTFTGPSDIEIDCDADASDLSLTGEVTDFSDSCGGEVTIKFTDVVMPGGCPNDAVITRSWTITDACGNASGSQQIITKKDRTPPTYTPPRDTVIDCSIGEQVEATGKPTNIQDNCGGGVKEPTFVDTVIDDPLCLGKYTVQRAWAVEDSCGNRVCILPKN